MTDTLEIVVYGTPAPQGSKRHVGNGVMVESSKKVTPWREDVKLAALRVLDSAPTWDRDHPVVTAHMVFVLARPRSHFRTGKNSHLLKDSAPYLVGRKPDLDKLVRSTGDALTAAGVWSDDSRLAVLLASKVFASPPGDPDREQPGARIVLAGGVR